MAIDFKAFVKSYLATAAWVTTDSPDENKDFTTASIKMAEYDCRLFINKVIDAFGLENGTRLLTIPGSDLAYLSPHDFFLTRNGHGTGFWDKEDIYGHAASRSLTDISKAMGEVDCMHERGKKSKLMFV
jgi:hypothetical protein